MPETILAHEADIRLSVFLGMLAVMAVWELAAPRRRLDMPRLVRWTNNLGLVVLDTVLVRLLFPVLAVGLALIAQDRGWGLFNLVAVPEWLALAASVLLLDLAIYFQHVVFHATPALWRLHRVHHADLDCDVTTGLRFHPVEVIVSMIIKMAVVVALGAPAVAVLAFEVILNATALFTHGNARIPARMDRVLRWALVTPDMHRVHHSVHRQETDSNFGFSLSCWDRLFGTYRAAPRDGHRDMRIGLEHFRTSRELWLDRMLIQPLRDTGPRGRAGSGRG
ncbi:MAG: sterol desaturase family protein [Pseudomonadota bacterium]